MQKVSKQKSKVTRKINFFFFASSRRHTRCYRDWSSGVCSSDLVDPLAGSYYVERLTDEVESRSRALIQRVDELGGAVAAIERGFQKQEIERSAYDDLRAVEAGRKVVVGVNRHTEGEEEPVSLMRLDTAIAEAQAKSLAEVRAQRDGAAVQTALHDLRDAARGEDNLLVPMHQALRHMATVGEVCDTLREVFGVYRPSATL